MISDEIGGGNIRQEVQDAIIKELNYRLGDGDVSSALFRWEKELLLFVINLAKSNSCLSRLHSQAAIKAGANIDQVYQVSLSILSLGMINWKMAGLGAIEAAEETAKCLQHPRRLRKTSPSEERRLEEIKQYVRQVLHHDLPDMWKKLANIAPIALDGYMRIRESYVNPDSSGALPKKTVELAIVCFDILKENSWGAQLHARQAIMDGASVPEVVDAVALVVIEGGVPTYKTGGLDVIETAEKTAAELAHRSRA